MRRRWLKSKLRDHVLVGTTEEMSFEGVLMHEAADGLVLLHAVMNDENGKDLPMEGEVFIPREKILFTQIAKARS